MRVDYLDENELHTLKNVELVIGHCVVTLLIKKMRITTENILSQIVIEMESTPDESKFKLYRTALEFLGTNAKNR
ncbi:biofilm development regulator YmgB/AriR family protein [Serratia sp. 1D1416]|uniref:biofilm development regulator YmgB/AriR family protein n=1 Tax=Serratia sp. 1D1416 TaxID=2447890 RepID=UPI001013CECD